MEYRCTLRVAVTADDGVADGQLALDLPFVPPVGLELGGFLWPPRPEAVTLAVARVVWLRGGGGFDVHLAPVDLADRGLKAAKAAFYDAWAWQDRPKAPPPRPCGWNPYWPGCG